jgi:crotonobetainyl-CoA:carnitine CoA-transferase CaiB-like acyl-CoA transferase
MHGIKVVEVAQYTFTPAAGAVLADWGADVIKVEHAEHGDAQRGIKIGTGGAAQGSFQPLMEHPNRGKRSIGLALDNPAGYEILMDLVSRADVFLINFLGEARRRLRLEVSDIRRANPKVIYVRGSGHGQRGPDAEKGGYDGTTFWSRSGSAWGATPPDNPRMVGMPAGAYGDSMGGATMAGGIAAALLARERTGEPSIVDVSLMSIGTWAMALSINNAMLTGEDNPPFSLKSPSHIPVNPLIGTFRTSDGRWISFNMLQPGRYFADVCRHLGLDHLIGDERFDTAEKLMANAAEAGAYITDALASHDHEYWLKQLRTMEGAWAPVQSPLEVSTDPQMAANGYIRPVVDAEGHTRRLVASPVQFDEQPPDLTRAPLFAEHTDEILRLLGKTEEEIIELKISGACT